MSENKDKLVDFFNKAAEFVNAVSEKIESVKQESKTSNVVNTLKDLDQKFKDNVENLLASLKKQDIENKTSQTVAENSVDFFISADEARNHYLETVRKKNIASSLRAERNWIYKAILAAAQRQENKIEYTFGRYTDPKKIESVQEELTKSGYFVTLSQTISKGIPVSSTFHITW